MFGGTSRVVGGWLFGLRNAWPLIVLFVVLAFLLGRHVARFPAPLTPPFNYSNTSSTVELSGTLRMAGASPPNATQIFCWFPANSCQVTVAELIPNGAGTRLELNDTEFDIRQLSDASLTATASTTDPCRAEILHVDRANRSATVSVGPSDARRCPNIQTVTATLGG